MSRIRSPRAFLAVGLAAALSIGATGCMFIGRFFNRGVFALAEEATTKQLETGMLKSVGPDRPYATDPIEPEWVVGKRNYHNALEALKKGEDQQAQRLFEEALVDLGAYSAHDPDSLAAREAWTLLARANTSLAEIATRAGAESRAETARAESARWYARVAADSYAWASIRAEALMALGNRAFLAEDYRGAEANYVQAMGDFPDLVDRELIYYRLGVVFRARGNGMQAREYFNLLVANFPDSPLSAEVRTFAEWKHLFYTVELGRPKTVPRAVAMVDDLRARGVDAAIVEYRDRHGRTYFSLQRGRYVDQSQAESALSSIAGDIPGGPDWKPRILP